MAQSPEPLPLTVARQIDADCDRFEAEWRAGRQPRIEDYLGVVRGHDVDEPGTLEVPEHPRRPAGPRGRLSHRQPFHGGNLTRDVSRFARALAPV